YLLVQIKKGMEVPCVTSAFWSTDGWWLNSGEPWPVVMANGAERLLRPALSRVDVALEYLRNAYALSARQMTAILSLYERRMAAATERLPIPATELAALSAHGSRSVDIVADFIKDHYGLNNTDVKEMVRLPPFGTGSVKECSALLAAAGIDVTN